MTDKMHNKFDIHTVLDTCALQDEHVRRSLYSNGDSQVEYDEQYGKTEKFEVEYRSKDEDYLSNIKLQRQGLLIKMDAVNNTTNTLYKELEKLHTEISTLSLQLKRLSEEAIKTTRATDDKLTELYAQFEPANLSESTKDVESQLLSIQETDRQLIAEYDNLGHTSYYLDEQEYSRILRNIALAEPDKTVQFNTSNKNVQFLTAEYNKMDESLKNSY